MKKKEEKNQIIDTLAEKLADNNNIYITDISELNVDKTNALRRDCFNKDVELVVVKNTLLRKAMEKTNKEFDDLYQVLKGPTSLMFSDINNLPAKIIKVFRANSKKPILKGAFVEETTYIGDEQLDALVNIKSKNELIADVVALLQSPAKNVISALQSGGDKIAGVLKTLSEKPE
ncbi:MAG: 50S ribosomal protein L10 [Bacteroidales bacterium]|nr:50S ribosomal protein L10 [Bacteroidales bacterium]